ncbi:hypothetical protein DM01DRAFT_1392099 [Hesseltinella vesiculosa]|uniref:TPR-like protein n=1 Tax=Hesseltinella vesiculosa TaxID=101127 RepID=A0A1X2GVD3_9FUNG|nr:hypothetical protein DM01DRAFT_1392099 [Hesseltinella vesiculosa]
MPQSNFTATPANNLTAADQEVQDETVATAIHYLFSNQFMKAKHLLEKEAATDPLHSLGLGSMLFLKAIMTDEPGAHQECLDALMYTYDLTASQLEATVRQHSIFGHSVFQYLHHCYYYLKCGNQHITSHPSPTNAAEAYTSNGILRAHVIKAECCLQMAIIYLMQGSYVGYLQCGVNLRRAYSSYYYVWQEHQRMDQVHSDFLDQDTLSGLQFGIGAIHLILDALPPSIRRLVSSFTWKPEKPLGFALLHLCKQKNRIRSPWASLLLLAYYTTLTSYCPEMLTMEYTQPAIEVLLETQQLYPHSALILFFAGRTSRLGSNLTLSTQSFLYAIEISKSDWAEQAMHHLCTFEMTFNAMLQLDWDSAIDQLDVLLDQQYWSPMVLHYLRGASLAMRGQQTDAILDYAHVLSMATAASTSVPFSKSAFSSPPATTHDQSLVDLQQYVIKKVQFFEQSGYQDCGLSLAALEYVAIMDGFTWMAAPSLDECHTLVDRCLEQIMEMQQLEYMIRKREIDPETPLSTFVDQRAALLWLKATLLNVAGRYEEAIPHVNWIVDHSDDIEVDRWLLPFTYWQAGLIAWHMDNRTHARQLWEQACCYKHYPFETRLTMKIHLALQKADQLGVPSTRKLPASVRSTKFQYVSLATLF